MMADCGRARAMTDLKEVFMKLGNNLVLYEGFSPSVGQDKINPEDRSTRPLKLLTEWINYHGEARDFLREMGFEWAMPVDRNHQ